MTPEERARVRAWLEAVRQNPALTAPGAPFSLVPEVNFHFGGAQLKSERGLLEYAVGRWNGRPRELINEPDEDRATAYRAWMAKELERLESLGELFTAVARDRNEAEKRYGPRADGILATHVWCVPGRRESGELYPHMIISDDIGFWAYVATLLFDDKRGFGRDLKECERCQKLFLARPTGGVGRPQKRFCGPKCLDEAQKSDAPARQRRVRAQRLLEKKYRFGHDKARHAVKQAQKECPEAGVTELAQHARAMSAREHK